MTTINAEPQNTQISLLKKHSAIFATPR